MSYGRVIVNVQDFTKAQLLSWFVVLQPRGVKAHDLTVRLEDKDSWGTSFFVTDGLPNRGTLTVGVPTDPETH